MADSRIPFSAPVSRTQQAMQVGPMSGLYRAAVAGDCTIAL